MNKNLFIIGLTKISKKTSTPTPNLPIKNPDKPSAPDRSNNPPKQLPIPPKQPSVLTKK